MATEDTSNISTNEVIEEIVKEAGLLNLESECSSDINNSMPENDFILNGSLSEDSKKLDPELDLCDFIDEEELKQLEMQLTKEQLLNRKEEALQLKIQANAAYKKEEYFESIKLYTDALRMWPLEDKSERSILYSNRAASKINLKRKESAYEDCTKAIELNSNYVRAYIRKARLGESLDKLDEALEDYKKVLELDPGNKEALTATMNLPSKINERNEKLKTEMFGKLKDLGNMILKPFGLSTDNFNLKQDPVSGSYAVNFQQNSS